MSILKGILPGGWYKGKDPVNNGPVTDDNTKEKGWYAAVQRFNDKIAKVVAFNSKLLIFITLLFFFYLLFASVFQYETFSINQIIVHSSLAEKGYNSTFVAKKISYNITSLVNEVPDKLFFMFSSGEGKEQNELLFNRIMGKYEKKEIKIDMDVSVGGFKLPLREVTRTARSLFNMEDKSLDGDLTVEDNLIIMTLGFNSNGINKSYKSIKYNFQPNDSTKKIDVIDSLARETAKFVLSQYDPLVTLLIDYNAQVVYSSNGIQWNEQIYTEKERLNILKNMYLNYKKDKEMAIWAHAITGAIYTDIYRRLELPKYEILAVQHFEKAVEMDASFIDIVGLDLANIYSRDSNRNNEIRIYQEMIKSDPDNTQIHQKLLFIYADLDNREGYFKVLEDAFNNGLYIPENEMKRSPYDKYKEKDQFKALVKKYNEKNKPLFLTN